MLVQRYLKIVFLTGLAHSSMISFAQNIGISTATPAGKFHIKGTEDVSQFVIDANATQANTNPLLKFRKSDGTDLLWIHSDNPLNTFIGLNAGRVNNGGLNNTFLGNNAGYSNITAGKNTAIGKEALYSNVAGSNSTAIGYNAMQFSNSA